MNTLRKEISVLQKKFGEQIISKLKPLQNKVDEILKDDKDCITWITLYHHRDNNNHYNAKLGCYSNFDCEIEECCWMNIISDAKHLPLTTIANILESNIAEIKTNNPIWENVIISI